MVFHNLRLSALVIVLSSGVAHPVLQGGQPRHDFKSSDFARLRWIEGTWKGSGGGYDAFYERYAFVNDSTIEKVSFTDGTLKTVGDRSVFALRAGRIYDESAKSRYEASKVTASVAHFVPVRGANNSFQFTRMSRDKWTATILPKGGKKVVYEMRKM